MTVAELIEALKQFDADMPVVVKGFDEGGFDHIAPPVKVEIVQISQKSVHRGQFEETQYVGTAPTLGPAFNAVKINF